MTTNTASGAAIQRYKIGYHTDEWGQRSSTPSGIPDASGPWVRYEDHIAALAAGQATAAQPAATPLGAAELPDDASCRAAWTKRAAKYHGWSNDVVPPMRGGQFECGWHETEYQLFLDGMSYGRA